MPAAFAACALSLLIALAPPTASAQSSDPSRFIPLVATVLKVEAATRDGRTNVGTAITVAPGVVVTSCHVTRNARSVSLVKRGGRWPAAGQFADWAHDLCFLSVPSWRGTPVALATDDRLELYSPVVAMGFTRGADLSMSQGEITGLHHHMGGRIIQTTSRFSSGASGGALLDPEGRLIGVLTFRLRGNRHHYFAVPAEWVREQLPIPPERFEPIASDSVGRAFWEEGCCLPYFMQAGQLRAQARWPDLAALADRWLAADPADADAWFTRGLARARLRQPDEALDALVRATQIAPRHAEAWLELGSASAELGDAEAVARARRALVGMDSDLVQRLPPVAGANDPAGGGVATAGK